MEALNSRCASLPKQNMSKLLHHVAFVLASAVSDPSPSLYLSLSSVFERLMPHQRFRFPYLSKSHRTPVLVMFHTHTHTHLHLTYDIVRNAKFDQMSVCKKRPFWNIGMVLVPRDSLTVTCRRVYIQQLVPLWRHCCTVSLYCTSAVPNYMLPVAWNHLANSRHCVWEK